MYAWAPVSIVLDCNISRASHLENILTVTATSGVAINPFQPYSCQLKCLRTVVVSLTVLSSMSRDEILKIIRSWNALDWVSMLFRTTIKTTNL